MSSQYRYLAYRSFVSWCWCFLGRRVRAVLPACVVLRIHAEFPDAEGQYVRFSPVLDLIHIWARVLENLLEDQVQQCINVVCSAINKK